MIDQIDAAFDREIFRVNGYALTIGIALLIVIAFFVFVKK